MKNIKEKEMKKYLISSKCHSKEAREKAVNTMRERYGGVGFEIEEIKEKAEKSLANSGKVLTSSQQKKTYNTLLKLYPKIPLFNL